MKVYPKNFRLKCGFAEYLFSKLVPSPKKRRGKMIFKMYTQEIIGVLLIPLSYVVITLVVAIETGRYQDKRYGISSGGHSEVPARVKTWRMGVVGIVIMCAIAPFGERGYKFLECLVSALPVFLQPIAGALIFFIGAGSMCILMCLPHLCLKACCEIGYEL